MTMAPTRGGTERLEFFQGKDRLWYWRRVAANNEIVANSEGYQNRADAVKIACGLFPEVGVFIQDQRGEWASMSENVDETQPDDEYGETGLDPQTVKHGEEEGQEDAPADAEDGPEPTEPPVEE